MVDVDFLLTDIRVFGVLFLGEDGVVKFLLGDIAISISVKFMEQSVHFVVSKMHIQTH